MVERRLKSTRQRDLIVEEFLRTTGHVSAEDLLARVRRVDPKVSTATVYRTLRLLTESGLANPRQFGGGQTRYETTVGRMHHDHIICTACGAILEFEDDQIESLQAAVAERHGFKVVDHKLELYGLCRACQAAAPTAPRDEEPRA